MAKTSKKVEEGQKKEFTMEQVGAFWKETSKAGNSYFSGGIEGRPARAFYVTKKKNPKEPDIRIYLYNTITKEMSKEVKLSLWCNVGKNDKKYLTGKLGDNRVVGFINEKATKENKQPYFSIYLSEDKPKMEEITDDSLPF